MQESSFQATGKSIIEKCLDSLRRMNEGIDLIEKDDVSPIYYLSPNAAEGILRRVDNQGRTLFYPLRIALEKLKDNK